MRSGGRPLPGKKIFISYRREDTAGHAIALYNRLCEHFEPGQIFMDFDSIEPGVDFVTVLEEAVGSCEVLLALIGKRWLSCADATGRRLDNPRDFVALELQTALNRNIRVIPILLDDAQMPRTEELPESLRALSRRNALEIGNARFNSDVERLVELLSKIVGSPPPASAPEQTIVPAASVPEKASAPTADASSTSLRPFFFFCGASFLWTGFEALTSVPIPTDVKIALTSHPLVHGAAFALVGFPMVLGAIAPKFVARGGHYISISWLLSLAGLFVVCNSDDHMLAAHWLAYCSMGYIIALIRSIGNSITSLFSSEAA